jgi:transposase
MYVYEHVLAKCYGWDLASIRKMDYFDFQAHLAMCIAGMDWDIEMKARLAGALPEKTSGNKTIQRVSKNKIVQTEQLVKL